MWHPKRMAAIAAASVSLVAWAEAQGYQADFEAPAYQLGQLEGQGIWIDWLGNNTDFTKVVNTNNSTPGGSQCIEVTNGADTVADFDQLPGGSFDSGQWIVKVQSYVPTGSGGRTYFLVMNNWDVTGAPPYEWNVQMALYGGFNRVQTSTPNGVIERPIIKDQWVEIRCEFDLDNHSVSVYYNNDLQATYDPRCGVTTGCGVPYATSSIDAIDLYPDPGTFPGPVYFDDLRVDPVGATNIGAPYCFGAGAGTPCPCGNTGGPTQGCANSSGQGAVLTGFGSTSVSADDAVFTGQNLLPGQPGLLFFADVATNGGNGVIFGDGLRCASQNIRRRGIRVPNAQGTAVWGPGLLAGTGVSGGQTKYWQIWYRDPSGGGACGNAFNLSHGLATALTP
jgi:hypothetical protein